MYGHIILFAISLQKSEKNIICGHLVEQLEYEGPPQIAPGWKTCMKTFISFYECLGFVLGFQSEGTEYIDRLFLCLGLMAV